MKRLNPLDASWLMVESRETPMHVGNLAIFSLPTDAPDDFIQKLFERAKTYEVMKRGRKYTWVDGRSLEDVERMPRRAVQAKSEDGCAVCHL